jgi:hypothetical protein
MIIIQTIGLIANIPSKNDTTTILIDKIRHHFIKLKIIEEHYNLITADLHKYKSYDSKVIVNDTLIYGKYYIDQLKNKLFNMKYIVDVQFNGNYHNNKFKMMTKKMNCYDREILTISKYIMMNLINSYNRIRTIESKYE